MNYSYLIEDIAIRSDTSKIAVKKDVDTFLGAIADALVRGEEVRLPGLGTLVVHKRDASTGRNPRTGETMEIAAKRVAKLRPGKALAQRLNPAAPASAAKRPRRRA
jgi:DNA-binding protein HU-beta